MTKVFGKIIDIFTSGDRDTVFRLLLLMLISLVVFPIIANYFYGIPRLNQKIELIKELNEINKNDINDPRLLEYYNKTLTSLVESRPNSIDIAFVFESPKIKELISLTHIVKFISAIFLPFLIGLSVIFSKEFSFKEKVFSFCIFLFFLLLVGFIGIYFIPTVKPFFINIFGMPVIEFFFVSLLVLAGDYIKRKKAERRA